MLVHLLHYIRNYFYNTWIYLKYTMYVQIKLVHLLIIQINNNAILLLYIYMDLFDTVHACTPIDYISIYIFISKTATTIF